MTNNRHPYVQAPKHLSEAIARFKKSIPSTVVAETFQKLGIASKNERYLLNTLRFLGIIDDAGKPTDDARSLFSQVDDTTFRSDLSNIVRRSYPELFELRGDDAWKMTKTELVTYFRQTDQTTDIVGHRQATTFSTLSALCGLSEAPQIAPTVKQQRESSKKTTPSRKRKTTTRVHGEREIAPSLTAPSTSATGVSLTVRIEINLPAGGDQSTYDNIFRSIREHLISE